MRTPRVGDHSLVDRSASFSGASDPTALASGSSKRALLSNQCIHKAVQLVVSARLPLDERGQEPASRSFNFEAEERPKVRIDVQRILAGGSAVQLDIVLRRSDDSDDERSSRRGDILLERWSLNFERKLTRGVRVDDSAVYKRMLLLLRSLYACLRVLPAQTVVKRLQIAYGGIDQVGASMRRLAFRINSDEEARNGSATVFDGPPLSFVFAPIDWIDGVLKCSVFYRRDCSFEFLRTSTASSSMSVALIYDYIAESHHKQDVSIIAVVGKSPALQDSGIISERRQRSENISIPRTEQGLESATGTQEEVIPMATPPFVESKVGSYGGSMTPPASFVPTVPQSVGPWNMTSSPTGVLGAAELRSKPIRLTVSPFKTNSSITASHQSEANNINVSPDATSGALIAESILGRTPPTLAAVIASTAHFRTTIDMSIATEAQLGFALPDDPDEGVRELSCDSDSAAIGAFIQLLNAAPAQLHMTSVPSGNKSIEEQHEEVLACRTQSLEEVFAMLEATFQRDQKLA